MARRASAGAGAALGEFYNKQTAAVADFGKTAVKAWDDTSKSIGNATDAWGEVITATMDERDAALRGFTDKIAAADQLRIKYEQVKVAKEKAGEDPLKRGQQNRGTDTASEAQRAQFEALKASLQLEEKTVQESYRKRMALVRNMTKEGSAERRELETALEQQTASAMVGANE